MAGTVVSMPRITIQLREADIVDAFEDRRDLIVGQLGPSATADDGALLSNVKQYSKSQLKALLGVGELYHRVQAWQASNGGYSPLDVIGVDPSGTGAAATSVITVTGTATAAGTYTISVVDAEQFTATVSIASGTAATAAGAAIASAINALTDKIFTAANSTGTVTITAADVGTVANYFGLSVTGSVAGLSVALTAWTGGANDPTVTGIFDVIGETRYTGISWPEYWDSSKSEVIDLLEDRFNAANAIRDGVAFIGKSLTYANALSYASALNTQVLVAMGSGKGTYAPASLRPADWVVAEFMGIRARRLTQSAPISDYVLVANAPKDTWGGAHTASLPYFNTPLADTPVGVIVDQYSETEQADLEDAGFSIYGTSRSLNDVVTGPIVTTRKTDAAGNVNVSFKYLEYVDTSSACREVFWKTLKKTFAQSRLTEGDLIPGLSMANAGSIRAACVSIYRVLANAGLVQAGKAAEAAFAANCAITVSLATRNVQISAPLYIVTQLGSIDYTLQLSFTVGQTGTQITL